MIKHCKIAVDSSVEQRDQVQFCLVKFLLWTTIFVEVSVREEEEGNVAIVNSRADRCQRVG